MTDPFLLLTPVLVGGVLALVRFVGCDKVLGFEPISAPPTDLVDFVPDVNTPPTLRNDYTGWVGMMIQPQADQTLVALGRWCADGNTGDHQVKVVDAGTGQNVTGAIVTVSLAGKTANTFVFADLSPAIKLAGGSYYYILSQEQMGKDVFIDYNITVTPTADFLVPGAAFGDPDATPPAPYMRYGGENNCYGPVNARY